MAIPPNTLYVKTTDWRLADTIQELGNKGYRVIASESVSKHKMVLTAKKVEEFDDLFKKEEFKAPEKPKKK